MSSVINVKDAEKGRACYVW